MITHNHLKTAIQDYTLSPSKDLLLRLVNELRYSNLYIPSKRIDGKPSFDVYEEDGLKLTVLFTDLDEAVKFYGSDDTQVFAGSFELYRNILKTSDIEGYILNPASERYLLDNEFILSITDIPKTTYVSTDPYSPEELKVMCGSDNSGLESFIENPANAADFEALFENLSKSTVFAMMLSDTDLDGFFNDGMLDMRITGPVASMYVDEVGGKYAAIFSSTQKMKSPDAAKFAYAQIINLSMLVNYVLTEDMDGIILNPSSDDVLIPRQKLLAYSIGFERYGDDERLADSMYYIFPL